jgi:hypothetical protein
MREEGRDVRLRRRTVVAVDEQYEREGEGGMDDSVDELEPEHRQPPSEAEAEQDNYANTDDEES